jgi:hypothetical protein
MISSSAVQVGALVRFADHLFATGRCVLIKPAARRPSSSPSTSLWASDDMGWLRDPPRGLQEKEEAARAREARRTRVLCAPNAATVRTTSAMAESVRDSTLDARSGCALCAVAPCARAVCEVSGRCTHLQQTSIQRHERLIIVAS